MSLSEQGDILIRELFAGDMTPQRHRELEDWLREDKGNPKLLAEFAVVERLLFIEQKKLDASAILALLLEAEENAEPMLVTIHSAKDMQDDTRITFKQACSAMGYLFSQGMRTRTGMIAGVAAALVLAAVLTFVLIGNPTNELAEQPIAIADPTFVEPRDDQLNSVAVLTDEQHAQWQAASGTILPRVGASLEPGERLTLTSGFAEITTQRGAIVVIEAPSTIEMTDQENSIVLHAGRLIGVCETPSSKGLLVRTPHMDITDLGTRFGVDASDPDATEVHVIEGEVKVGLYATQGADVEQVLSAGEALAARADSRVLVVVAADVHRFAALDEKTEHPGPAQLAGVHQMTGDLQPGSASLFIGKDVKQWPTSKNAFLFEEFAGRMDSPFMVNLVESGSHAQLPATPETEVPAGTTLRSYILIKTRNPDNAIAEVQGSVTFEDEVIGIIAEQSAADTFAGAVSESSRVFAPRTKTEQWADFKIHQDRVTLSEDRRTITFAFRNKDSADMIRVLVAAEEADGQP